MVREIPDYIFVIQEGVRPIPSEAKVKIPRKGSDGQVYIRLIPDHEVVSTGKRKTRQKLPFHDGVGDAENIFPKS